MHKLTLFPLGNADSYLIELSGGQKLLFDYANVRDPEDETDLRIDLPGALREKLDTAGLDGFDVVAFTHLDKDHICGATEFFELRHDDDYQGDERIEIGELWVPAAAITEEDLEGEAAVLQAEARHRLREGSGIRAFSRPGKLRGWLKAQGLELDDRRHLITDAGQLVPGWEKGVQGIELFAHSPFAVRKGLDLEDRNTGSLVLQATFAYQGRETCFLLAADVDHHVLTDIVGVTRGHNREDRLEWDVFKLPHHCSYLSLSDERGDTVTEPVADVKWLFEDKGQQAAILISTSKPIPSDDSDNQPPHRQAANYYKGVADSKGGEFKVTMEHPTQARPEPLVITIGRLGATVEKRMPLTGVATSRPAPRAG